jgi:hypothetical protein
LNTTLTSYTPRTRRAALGATALVFTGGALAGPVGTALAADHSADKSAVSDAAGTREATTTKPSMEKLIPHGTQGAQSRITLTDEQRGNAKAIVEATKKAGMDERAAVVAIATALQESKLQNLGHLGARNDHDSQGLFQQRPSTGWGTVAQITNPEYATTAFLNGLRNVPGWQDMPLTQAAQKVQVSAYPFHYAQWETQAAELVAELW